jgi:hypothetical protein
MQYTTLRDKNDLYHSDISDGEAYKNILSKVRPGWKLLPIIVSWDGFELWRKAAYSIFYFLIVILKIL